MIRRYNLSNPAGQPMPEDWIHLPDSVVAAADYDALAAERDRWRKVASDVCGHMDLECQPGCDSYGHVEGCGVYDLCVTVDNLRARMAEAERDAKRWRNARRLADDISDPTLRGIVITFLDRFGTAT